MTENSQWALIWLSLLAMLSLWFGLWLHWAKLGKQRIPAHWPLHARVLVNAEELRVWRWLAETFDDHHVMIKMPVTRFTRPTPAKTAGTCMNCSRTPIARFQCVPVTATLSAVSMYPSLSASRERAGS